MHMSVYIRINLHNFVICKMLWTVREKNYGNRDHVLMCECSRVPDIIIIKEILTSKST